MLFKDDKINDMKKILLLIIVSVWTSIFSFAQSNGANERYYQIAKNIEIYGNVINELNNSYVDQIEPGKMLKDALDAMLIQLDPFTNYISEYDVLTAAVMQKNGAEQFGFSLKKNSQGKVVILQVLEQSAAADKGIQPGFILKSINGKTIEGYDVDDLNIIIKAVSSNGLQLELENPGLRTVQQYELKESNNKMPSAVTYASVIGTNKDIALISLAQFTPNCSQEIKAKLDSLKSNSPQQHLAGVILDFRNNPGGLLDEAVKICGLFIEKGKLVVSTKGKTEEWNKQFMTESTPWDLKIPVGIMLNASSASASEVVAGTLQDYDRAVIIGEQSYGKGLVQVYKDIGYKAKLKLTTAKYYTPSGRCIQAIDYTNRTQDGKALKIADTARKTFKTTKGRTVYDGAGILPDINQVAKASNYIKSVIANGLVFDYVTQYVQKNRQIPDVKQFQLSDTEMHNFINWIIEQPVNTGSAIEQRMAELNRQMQQEKMSTNVNTAFTQLEQSIKTERKSELAQYKSYFKQLLTEEIITRFHNKSGAMIYTINNKESSLSQLLKVLEDTNQYHLILNK